MWTHRKGWEEVLKLSFRHPGTLVVSLLKMTLLSQSSSKIIQILWPVFRCLCANLSSFLSSWIFHKRTVLFVRKCQAERAVDLSWLLLHNNQLLALYNITPPCEALGTVFMVKTFFQFGMWKLLFELQKTQLFSCIKTTFLFMWKSFSKSSDWHSLKEKWLKTKYVRCRFKWSSALEIYAHHQSHIHKFILRGQMNECIESPSTS